MSDIAAYGDFLRGLVNDPRGVSAPTPSSPALGPRHRGAKSISAATGW